MSKAFRIAITNKQGDACENCGKHMPCGFRATVRIAQEDVTSITVKATDGNWTDERHHAALLDARNGIFCSRECLNA